jgi:hypothetical protein
VAIRTTDDAVAAIIEVDTDIPLTPFIAAASALVDRVSQQASRIIAEGIYTLPSESGDATLPELLGQIETWLSAHFYAMRDPRAVQERAGEVQVTYQSAVTYNLFLSHYGQMAMTLDFTGTLRAISDGKANFRVGVSWLGKDHKRCR